MTGPNPTDRRKLGTKRSILVDGRGVPLGVAVAGANRVDFQLLQATLDSIAEACLLAREDVEQGLWLDKGYDFDEIHGQVRLNRYVPHIIPRDAERQLLVNYKAMAHLTCAFIAFKQAGLA